MWGGYEYSPCALSGGGEKPVVMETTWMTSRKMSVYTTLAACSLSANEDSVMEERRLISTSDVHTSPDKNLWTSGRSFSKCTLCKRERYITQSIHFVHLSIHSLIHPIQALMYMQLWLTSGNRMRM